MGLDSYAVRRGTNKPADELFGDFGYDPVPESLFFCEGGECEVYGGLCPGHYAEFKPRAYALRGSLFSGTGAAFRGKVYSDLIEKVAGVSLYAERLSVASVAQIAAALSATAYSTELDITEHEYLSLREFFRRAAENSLENIGWW